MKKNLPVTQKEVTLGDNTTIISTTDLKGQITYANREFVRISGFSEEELIGKSHNIVRHPDMPPEAFKNLWDTISSEKGSQTWRGIVKNRCKNGDYYWVDAFVTSVADNNNKIIGYQSVRTRPTREQISAAESLYEKLNSKKISAIPNKFKITDISLMKRMSVALLVASVLPFTGDALWSLGLVSKEVMVFLALLTPVILITSLWLFYKTMMQPIYQVINIAKGIAGGDLNQAINVANNDEVGELLMAMKLMQARLQTIIGKLIETSKDVTQDALILSSSSKQTFDLMSEQQVETERVATAMNKMNATVAETKRSAEEALQAVINAGESAEKGKQITNQVHNSIDQFVHRLEDTSEAITDLEDRGDDILSIMSVIHGIADQTSLLALNASIEAARAGDQGRGFAVVADEVRMLAGRTQVATDEINSVIEELRTGIDNAAHVMGKGRKQAYDAIEDSKLAEAALNKIMDSVNQINNVNTQIVTVTNQQAVVAEEMDRNIININQMSAGTVDAAQYNSDASIRLNKLSVDMQKQFSNFDLGNKDSLPDDFSSSIVDDDGLF